MSDRLSTVNGGPDCGHLERSDYYVLLALVALTAALAYFLTGGRHIDWQAPLLYDADSILHLIFIKRLIDGQGYFLSTAAGFPFDSNLYDFPGSDGASLVALWALGKSIGSAPLALNIYYMAGFPLAAVAGYVVLRKLFVTRLWANVFALLFALLPFHFLRIAHLYYTWYFTIPVFIWYSIQVCEGFGSSLRTRGATRWALDLTLLVISASLGVYYAFFGAILIGLSGIYGLLRERALRPLVHSLILITFITFGVLLNVAPNLKYFSEHDRNQVVAQRQAEESEIYGLKIAQLLLPQPQHRSKALSEITRSYSARFPLVNENSFAALGLVGGVGFLLLLHFALTPQPAMSKVGRIQRQLGFLLVILLLIATIGGFSSLFAQFITSLIRAWNRVSIFIAFMALTGLALAVNRAFLRRHRIWCGIGAVMIVGVGLWDQTSRPDTRGLEKMQADFRADRSFVARLDSTLPPGSAVYQLPYMTFPEARGLQDLGSYDLGKAYLHSRHLRWSFGATAGREGDDFYGLLSRQPIAIQIELIAYMGFKGIYIDRRGYADHGASLETGLRQVLSEPPVVQDNGHLVFYPIPAPKEGIELSPAAEKIRTTFGLHKTDGKLSFAALSPFNIDFTRSTTKQLRSVSGLYGAEPWGTWTQGPMVTMQFRSALPGKFTLQLTANAFGPNSGTPVTVSVAGNQKIFTPSATVERYDLEFTTDEKTDTVQISVPHPISPKQLGISIDGRMIGLGLVALDIVSMGK